MTEARPTPFAVTIANTGEVFRCAPEVSVLEAMEKAMCRGIPVGCRNGGCGACKIRIIGGEYVKKKMNRAVVSVEEEAQGYALACKTFPRGDMTVNVVGTPRADAARGSAGYRFEFGTAWRISQTDKES